MINPENGAQWPQPGTEFWDSLPGMPGPTVEPEDPPADPNVQEEGVLNEPANA